MSSPTPTGESCCPGASVSAFDAQPPKRNPKMFGFLKVVSVNSASTEPRARKMPTVSFDASRVNAAVMDNVRQTLASLPGMPSPTPPAVMEAVKTCVERGGAHAVLFAALKQHLPESAPQGEVEEMTRFVNAQARALMDRDRQLGLGIVQAKWSYSNAPCKTRSARDTDAMTAQDKAHKAANGNVYDVATGLTLQGKPTWPGMEPGCKCTFRLVVPFLER